MLPSSWQSPDWATSSTEFQALFHNEANRAASSAEVSLEADRTASDAELHALFLHQGQHGSLVSQVSHLT